MHLSHYKQRDWIDTFKKYSHWKKVNVQIKKLFLKYWSAAISRNKIRISIFSSRFVPFLMATPGLHGRRKLFQNCQLMLQKFYHLMSVCIFLLKVHRTFSNNVLDNWIQEWMSEWMRDFGGYFNLTLTLTYYKFSDLLASYFTHGSVSLSTWWT